MATASTLVSRNRMPHSPMMNRLVYTIPSVLPSATSPRYSLETMVVTGVIRQVKFVMVNNAMVHIYFGQEDIDFRGTIAEVDRIRNIAQDCVVYPNRGAIFENTDTPTAPKSGTEHLYIEIENTSTVTATGEITLELILDEGGTR